APTRPAAIRAARRGGSAATGRATGCAAAREAARRGGGPSRIRPSCGVYEAGGLWPSPGLPGRFTAWWQGGGLCPAAPADAGLPAGRLCLRRRPGRLVDRWRLPARPHAAGLRLTAQVGTDLLT